MTAISKVWNRLVFEKVSIAPLVTFRILFGLLMFASAARFWLNGWIETQYVNPTFHFKYFGFHWVPELPEVGYYLAFAILGISALLITVGAFYRWAALAFFLVFTYIELIDVTYYLNHYYFVSLAALIMIFVPANRSRSLDVLWGRVKPMSQVSARHINALKFQLALVYFFAGIAKLNPDWLINAMPLAIWLPAQDQLPIVGYMLQWKWSPYLFSWAGAIYDLLIPFLLVRSNTRPWAYLAVVVFHILTWSLFQIGMFPFIMIGLTLIFFSSTTHAFWQEKLLGSASTNESEEHVLKQFMHKNLVSLSLVVFVSFQLAFPFRHLMYDGNLFWHEQGYRFGWRVMLMEKAGYAQFFVEDESGRTIEVQNSDFLTPAQEKMMSTQPDLLIQYAHYLENIYSERGIDAHLVRANVYVSLNGEGSKRFIDPKVNLASVADSWQPKTWILPYGS